jgi:hypothetical protein
MFHLLLFISLIESTKIDYHDWYLLVIVGAGLVSVALTMLSEIIDKAKIVYFKIRDFKKSHDVPMGKPSP